jgi:predicted Zn-dependent protease
VGTRSGDPADVERLLVAGLYHQARAEREAGDSAEAARLTEELARHRPNDFGVQLLLIESTLRDRKDPARALEALAQLTVPAEDTRGTLRVGLLRSEAYVASGQPESARAVLSALAEQFPDSPPVKDAIAKLP